MPETRTQERTSHTHHSGSRAPATMAWATLGLAVLATLAGCATGPILPKKAVNLLESPGRVSGAGEWDRPLEKPGLLDSGSTAITLKRNILETTGRLPRRIVQVNATCQDKQLALVFVVESVKDRELIGLEFVVDKQTHVPLEGKSYMKVDEQAPLISARGEKHMFFRSIYVAPVSNETFLAFAKAKSLSFTATGNTTFGGEMHPVNIWNLWVLWKASKQAGCVSSGEPSVDLSL